MRPDPLSAYFTSWSHVSIFDGIVTATDDADIVIGERRFFVELVDEEGFALDVWNGTSREAALSAAAEVAEEGALRVCDQTGGRLH